MSRSGYTDDCDNIAMYRGQVASAIRGKRGQAFLRDLLAALEAMPEKKLVRQEFETDGAVCALGSVAKVRGIDLSKLDPEDDSCGEYIAPVLGIASQLAREIMWENDEFRIYNYETGRERDEAKNDVARWKYMRDWVAAQIRPTPEECAAVELP